MTEKNTIVTDSFQATLATISRKLREVRKSVNLSLDDLSARSGVSKGSLVKLEGGQGNPGVAVLCQVAAALGISLADLVEHSSDSVPTGFDPAGGRVVWRGKNGGWARLVVGTPGPEMVELWEWELCPAERYEASAHSRGTRELILATRGKLGVSVGSWKGAIRSGQGVLITTDVEHSYWCEGSKPVRFRMFVAEWPAA